MGETRILCLDGSKCSHSRIDGRKFTLSGAQPSTAHHMRSLVQKPATGEITDS
jgi:hypothetical protein